METNSTTIQPSSSLYCEDRVFDKLVLTASDVAKELHCSLRLVQKLVSEGRIPYAKVGRLVRFSRVQILDWLNHGGSL